VIEVTAHILGASCNGRKIGSLRNMTMFSFHTVKHITPGKGGMIKTNNKGFYEKIIQFPSHWNFKKLRQATFEALRKQNIGVNVHYIPVHLLPYYQQLGFERGLLPQAEKLYEEIISLPLFPAMTD